MNDLYDLPDLEMLALDCLTRAGLREAEAQIVARDVALAEAAGEKESGFSGLLRDIRLLRYGRIHPEVVPQITAPTAAVLHVDAKHGFAAPALAQALPLLIKAAQHEGLALLHLTNASDPGAMAAAMADLSEAGYAGISLRPQERAFAVRPKVRLVTPIETGAQSMLSSLLSMAPPPTDSPLDGPIAQSGWITALNPGVTAVDELLDGLPTAAPTGPERSGIAMAPELLAQIVNA